MAETRTTCPYCGVGCGVLAEVDAAGQVSVRAMPNIRLTSDACA
ncbi:Molybdopterin oxidoreductase Fe4S4 domain [Raoultella terrigena]|uniref:Molybdopterin oxidoreductase Fe4S4 domain n=1 Tax=Raoultella terrigena TaxID=577 RepID=A0A4U9CV10_RAOTE|nr:Molybdopterin oxidoreductase Fe4S4 domain [Raoultella terrigena]